ncbi:MAG: glycosyltransferase family 2 protein [Methylococcales symbiont of Hymedesmia sp. n. MRB-2018]|nr:MAG: glycosyltransferase family 2 protein [Methylococcales symbiont of Hymedesmia sp. n. MRB-2018]
MKICLVIPVYNHEKAIVQIIAALEKTQLPCFLINDGSSNECSTVLQNIAQQKHWVTLYQRTENGGKGAAVIDGLKLAFDTGFSHAIQIDADGQHCLEDIIKFQQAAEQQPEKMILGAPKYDKKVPKGRLYGRQFTNLWIWINTLSFAIKDGMCGFRCYPLAAVNKVLKSTTLGQRMDFDIEILVRLYWQGLDIVNIETQVNYPLDGISHFNMLKDNILISKKHAQLFFAMLPKIPHLLARHRP